MKKSQQGKYVPLCTNGSSKDTSRTQAQYFVFVNAISIEQCMKYNNIKQNYCCGIFAVFFLQHLCLFLRERHTVIIIIVIVSNSPSSSIKEGASHVLDSPTAPAAMREKERQRKNATLAALGRFVVCDEIREITQQQRAL